MHIFTGKAAGKAGHREGGIVMRKSAVLIALGLVLALSFGALAAPMVSGAVALLLTLHSELTPATVRQRLVHTSRHTASLAGDPLHPLPGGLLDVLALLRGAPNAVQPAGWSLYQ
jgi:hypothetical protein